MHVKAPGRRRCEGDTAGGRARRPAELLAVPLRARPAPLWKEEPAILSNCLQWSRVLGPRCLPGALQGVLFAGGQHMPPACLWLGLGSPETLCSLWGLCFAFLVLTVYLVHLAASNSFSAECIYETWSPCRLLAPGGTRSPVRVPSSVSSGRCLRLGWMLSFQRLQVQLVVWRAACLPNRSCPLSLFFFFSLLFHATEPRAQSFMHAR